MLQIVGITDAGVAYRERLHLRVTMNMNLGFAVVLDTQYLSPAAIAAGSHRAFWFPMKDVKGGDNVILYTGPGTSSETRNSDGSTNHFFYWGIPETIWGGPNAA